MLLVASSGTKSWFPHDRPLIKNIPQSVGKSGNAICNTRMNERASVSKACVPLQTFPICSIRVGHLGHTDFLDICRHTS